jgi:predicted cytidylate kinase
MARIVLSGDLGSGKSTQRTRIANALGYEEFYAGGYWRKKAERMGLLIEEFYAHHVTAEMDRELEAYQEHLIRKTANLVIEGRVVPFLAPETPKLKVFLSVSPAIGAERQKKRPENSAFSIAEIMRRTEERTAGERERYRTLYGISNHLDKRFFDIIIDTDASEPDDVFEKLMRLIQEHLSVAA